MTVSTTSDLWAISLSSSNFEADQAERVRWFNKIEPTPWKAAIDCWIDETDLEHCSNAAVWFAGCELKVEERKGNRVRVTAPGYWAAIGA